MAERIAVRFLVAGRVQGVFFRASTRTEAERLGLQGYARNLPDGRVEVLAAGPQSAIDSLAAWLNIGPPMASVSAVEHNDADLAKVPDGFEVRR